MFFLHSVHLAPLKVDRLNRACVDFVFCTSRDVFVGKDKIGKLSNFDRTAFIFYLKLLSTVFAANVDILAVFSCKCEKYIPDSSLKCRPSQKQQCLQIQALFSPLEPQN